MSIKSRIRSLKKKLTPTDEFWCELAITLGYTVAELQQKITWGEYILWLEYRAKYGPLNPIRMFDQGAAILAAQVNNAIGGKAKPEDFIFYGKTDKDEVTADTSLDAFVKSLGGVKIGKRR